MNAQNNHNGAMPAPPPVLPSKLPGHWVMFRLSSLGDVTLTTGPMRYWHEHYGWTFTVLTRHTFAPLFENNPAVTNVICPQKDELRLPHILAYFHGVASSHKDSGLLDLHGTARSRLLAALWKGPVLRYPKFGLERRLFVLRRGKTASARLLASSVTQRYVMAVTPSFPPAGELLPRIYLCPGEEEAAKERLRYIFRLASFKSSFAGAVALHPYATHFRKAWPKEYWLDLTRELDRQGRPWFVVGQGEGLVPGDPRDLSNQTDLRGLCALLGQAEALVTGDSGPMHLAAGTDTPVLAIFGPTTREWGFFPAGPRDIVMHKNLPCRPCSLHGADNCKLDGRCMRELEPLELARNLSVILAAADGTARETKIL